MWSSRARTAGRVTLRQRRRVALVERHAQAAGIERRLAQQMTYCLRAMGVLDAAEKRSGAVVHRRMA